jgi:CubicO group peptidase (beta-lactamase class C family)
VRRFFLEEVAPKLDGNVFLGLPAEEDGRHAGATGAPVPGTQFFDSPNPAAFMASMTNPMIDWDWPNQRRFREEGQPGSGASANARGLARLYASLVSDEGKDGLRFLSKAVLEEASRERICGIDQGSGGVGRYAAGFRLNTGSMGSNPASFGHPGLGGSVAFADPGRRLGIAYATSRLLNHSWQGADPRLAKLLVAVYAAESKR